jgi:hypothetical protein
MTQLASVAQSASGFAIKEQHVNLIGGEEHSFNTVEFDQLEASRVQGSNVPASKHGLEVLCGASCETGAI